MPAAQDPTTGRFPPPNTERGDAARRTALAALVHRLNGSLNNASLAFEVALGGGQDAATEQTLRTGLAAIAQASRAAMLLAHLVNGQRSTVEPSELFTSDVHDLLAELARSTGHAASSDLLSGMNGPADAARALVTEIARMERAG